MEFSCDDYTSDLAFISSMHVIQLTEIYLFYGIIIVCFGGITVNIVSAPMSKRLCSSILMTPQKRLIYISCL